MGKDKKTLYAVQLTKPKGTSNGTYECERLVNCPDHCALFLTPDKLKVCYIFLYFALNSHLMLDYKLQ